MLPQARAEVNASPTTSSVCNGLGRSSWQSSCVAWGVQRALASGQRNTVACCPAQLAALPSWSTCATGQGPERVPPRRTRRRQSDLLTAACAAAATTSHAGQPSSQQVDLSTPCQENPASLRHGASLRASLCCTQDTWHTDTPAQLGDGTASAVCAAAVGEGSRRWHNDCLPIAATTTSHPCSNSAHCVLQPAPDGQPNHFILEPREAPYLPTRLTNPVPEPERCQEPEMLAQDGRLGQHAHQAFRTHQDNGSPMSAVGVQQHNGTGLLAEVQQHSQQHNGQDSGRDGLRRQQNHRPGQQHAEWGPVQDPSLATARTPALRHKRRPGISTTPAHRSHTGERPLQSPVTGQRRVSMQAESGLSHGEQAHLPGGSQSRAGLQWLGLLPGPNSHMSQSPHRSGQRQLALPLSTGVSIRKRPILRAPARLVLVQHRPRRRRQQGRVPQRPPRMTVSRTSHVDVLQQLLATLQQQQPEERPQRHAQETQQQQRWQEGRPAWQQEQLQWPEQQQQQLGTQASLSSPATGHGVRQSEAGPSLASGWTHLYMQRGDAALTQGRQPSQTPPRLCVQYSWNGAQTWATIPLLPVHTLEGARLLLASIAPEPSAPRGHTSVSTQPEAKTTRLRRILASPAKVSINPSQASTAGGGHMRPCTEASSRPGSPAWETLDHSSGSQLHAGSGTPSLCIRVAYMAPAASGFRYQPGPTHVGDSISVQPGASYMLSPAAGPAVQTLSSRHAVPPSRADAIASQARTQPANSTRPSQARIQPASSAAPSQPRFQPASSTPRSQPRIQPASSTPPSQPDATTSSPTPPQSSQHPSTSSGVGWGVQAVLRQPCLLVAELSLVAGRRSDPGDDQLCGALSDMWRASQQVHPSLLVYTSQRSWAWFQQLWRFKQHVLELPDALILAGGTRIMYRVAGGGWQDDTVWRDKLDRDRHWDRRRVVAEVQRVAGALNASAAGLVDGSQRGTELEHFCGQGNGASQAHSDRSGHDMLANGTGGGADAAEGRLQMKGTGVNGGASARQRGAGRTAPRVVVRADARVEQNAHRVRVLVRRCALNDLLSGLHRAASSCNDDYNGNTRQQEQLQSARLAAMRHASPDLYATLPGGPLSAATAAAWRPEPQAANGATVGRASSCGMHSRSSALAGLTQTLDPREQDVTDAMWKQALVDPMPGTLNGVLRRPSADVENRGGTIPALNSPARAVQGQVELLATAVPQGGQAEATPALPWQVVVQHASGSGLGSDWCVVDVIPHGAGEGRALAHILSRFNIQSHPDHLPVVAASSARTQGPASLGTVATHSIVFTPGAHKKQGSGAEGIAWTSRWGASGILHGLQQLGLV